MIPRDGRLRVQHASLPRLVAWQRFTLPRAADLFRRHRRLAVDQVLADLPAFGANLDPADRGPGFYTGSMPDMSTTRRLSLAAFRPSAIAQTTRDCPRRVSPAAKTPGSDDI